jgi:hypothetical protein
MVELRRLPNLRQLQFLAGQGKGKNVHALCVDDCPQLRSMQLSQLTALECLAVKGCGKLEDLAGLGNLAQLKMLRVCGALQYARGAALAPAVAVNSSPSLLDT